MSRPILLCLFVLVAVSALAEAGRERRQLFNAFLGSALGYGQRPYGGYGSRGGYNQQGFGNYGGGSYYGGRPNSGYGYNQGYNQGYGGYNQGYGGYNQGFGGRPGYHYG